MKHTVVQHKNSEIPTVSGKRSPIIKKTFQPKKGTDIYLHRSTHHGHGKRIDNGNTRNALRVTTKPTITIAATLRNIT